MIRWTCGPLKVFHFIGNRLKVLYAFSGLSAGSVENGSQTNSRPGLSTSPRINRLFFAEACYDGYCGRVPRCNVLNMSFKRYVICVLKQSIYIYMFNYCIFKHSHPMSSKTQDGRSHFFTCFTQARCRGLQCCHQHPRPRCIPSVAICSWSKNRRFTPTKNGEPATILLAGLQWQRSLQMLKYMEARSFGGPAEGEIWCCDSALGRDVVDWLLIPFDST